MAEVKTELIYIDDEFSPYLSLEDAQKLDNVRLSLGHNYFSQEHKT